MGAQPWAGGTPNVGLAVDDLGSGVSPMMPKALCQQLAWNYRRRHDGYAVQWGLFTTRYKELVRWEGGFIPEGYAWLSGIPGVLIETARFSDPDRAVSGE